MHCGLILLYHILLLLLISLQDKPFLAVVGTVASGKVIIGIIHKVYAIAINGIYSRWCSVLYTFKTTL